ncbi:MAG: hypothetical protein Q7T71_06945 [Herbiconiux sp.]|nr:hypothetical protein [Herbiconiux sp.]
MTPRGSGVPLAERSRGPATRSGPCPMRHCWVSDAADGLGIKRPGLLVEWRQASAGWEGLVVYAAQLRPTPWTVVEEWLPAALLTPL